MNIPLSPEDRSDLYKLHKSTKEKKSADKIKMLILIDDGYSQKEIASILMIDEDTIVNRRKKFTVSNSLKDYLEDNYISYTGKITSEEKEIIKSYIKENTIVDSKQVIAYVEEKFGKTYTPQGMQTLLHKSGFSYKQLSLFPSKADLEKQREFVKDYEILMDNLSDNEEIVFMDGVHPQHNTKSSKAWIETGQEKYILTNTGRSRLNLNGAYNPKTQDVIIREDETINAQSTINLFKQIEEHYSDKDRIFVISDNARYYSCKILTDFLKDSKIKLIHLPPYSPNLNLIERLWKFMRKKGNHPVKYIFLLVAGIGIIPQTHRRTNGFTPATHDARPRDVRAHRELSYQPTYSERILPATQPFQIDLPVLA